MATLCASFCFFHLSTLMGNLQTSMFFIIPSSFLTEMCYRTESIFPHRTWTTLFYTGQFRDVRKTACPCLSVCQAEPVPQTVLLDVLPAWPCHFITTWWSSRVSPLPDGRLLEGWACCVRWTSTAQDTQYMPREHLSVFTSSPCGGLESPSSSFLACQNLVHRATKHCSGVFIRHVCP